MIYLNKALSEYGTGEVVPAYYVLFTACAVLGSAILYSDLDDSNMNSLATLVGSFWPPRWVSISSRMARGGQKEE